MRWGQVHVFNNLHVVTGNDFGYSLGVGVQSRICSERNVWETPANVASQRLVRVYKDSRFFDRESLHNGQAVDLLALLRATYPDSDLSADVGWLPSLHGPIDLAADVAARVRAGAGGGRLWAGPGHAP